MQYVVFTYNGENRPDPKKTHIFDQFRQVAAPVGRQMTLFGRDRYARLFCATLCISARVMSAVYTVDVL